MISSRICWWCGLGRKAGRKPWMKAAGLQLAPEKTEMVLVTTRRKIAPVEFGIQGHRILEFGGKNIRSDWRSSNQKTTIGWCNKVLDARRNSCLKETSTQNKNLAAKSTSVQRLENIKITSFYRTTAAEGGWNNCGNTSNSYSYGKR